MNKRKMYQVTPCMRQSSQMKAGFFLFVAVDGVCESECVGVVCARACVLVSFSTRFWRAARGQNIPRTFQEENGARGLPAVRESPRYWSLAGMP